jgi:predicted permease
MRTAWRLFTHHRSLTALAVSTLAVALGLATALASVADAILFRPLPVAHPEKIVRVFAASSAQPLGLVSYPDFADFRRSARSLTGVVAQSQVLLAAGDAPAQIRLALAVTPDYFTVLGVKIALGRSFRPEESRDAVVILSYSYWQSQFANDPRAIGRTILLCGTPFTILGVAPEDFSLDRFSREDLYIPMGIYETALLPATGRPLQDRSRRYLSVYARLAPAATIAQASAELASIASTLESSYPEDHSRRSLVLTEFQSRTYANKTMPTLAGLLGALAMLIVAIACANLAALLRERSESRAREMAVRMAVGATPAHLLRDSLIESATLTLTGAIFAIPLACAIERAISNAVALPTNVPFSLATQIDARLLLAATALLTLICGWTRRWPRHIAESLRTNSAPARTRFRHILAAIEIALATTLIGGSLFLLRGISDAQRTDPGYRTGHVLVLALDPAQVRYSEAQARVFYTQALDLVRALPGVKSAELAQSVPLGYTSAQRQIVVADETLTLWMNIAGPRYFDLMHLAILDGRSFNDADTAQSEPVAIVNQELAKRCGVGCIFRMGGRAVRVVGVVRTASYFAINESPRPYFYLPFSQNYASRMILHVETTGDPSSIAHPVAAALHRLDPNQPISEIRPASAYLKEGSLFQARIALRVLGSVSLAGIALAIAGLYAVISHAAARRKREIGIRIALGATRSAVMRLIAIHALQTLGAGIVIGSIGAAAAIHALHGLVPVSGGQLAILAFAVILVAVAAAPAFFVPARKASAADPLAALRAD